MTCSWSIINQLGGKISIRSELGKGTDVEITLPVAKAKGNIKDSRHSDLAKVSQEAEECITTICQRAVGISVSFHRTKSGTSSQQDATWNCIKRYCSEWFGFEVKPSGSSLVITDSDAGLSALDCERVLIVYGQITSPAKHDSRSKIRAVETISLPMGPFRLARCLLALMDQDLSNRGRGKGNNDDGNRSDQSTQTPLGSPAERAILNGIIATEYGFPTPETILANRNTNVSREVKNTIEAAIQTESTGQPSTSSGPSQMMTLKLPAFRNPSEPEAAMAPPAPASTGSLDIPIRTKLSKPAKPAKADGPPASTTPLHVLAVDDNELNLQLIHRLLQKRKCDIIVTARNGLEAVEAVRKAGGEDNFDVVFMDISMPVMNGFESTRLIRAYERNAPASPGLNSKTNSKSNDVAQGDLDVDGDKDINTSTTNSTLTATNGTPECLTYRRGKTKQRAYIIALTGLASRKDRDEADASGFDDFWTKPVPFGKIKELMERFSREKGELASGSASGEGGGVGGKGGHVGGGGVIVG